jgi:hypothetical protein
MTDENKEKIILKGRIENLIPRINEKFLQERTLSKFEAFVEEYNQIIFLMNKYFNLNYSVLKVYNSQAIKNKGIIEINLPNFLLYFEEKENIKLEEEERAELVHQRKEIGDMNLTEEIEKNILEAIKEYEKGCFLGSSLICGRINNWLLNKINLEESEIQRDSNKNIMNLIDTKVNKIIKILNLNKEKDEKSKLLRVAHFTRNYNSHDIFEMSESSKNLTYLGDSVQLIKIITNFEKETNKQEK